MEDFDLFTSQDRQDISYGACVGGATLVGVAYGRFGMVPGLLAGAAVGLAVGLMTCKRLSPMIEKKIFSRNDRLSDPELLSALKAVRDITGVRTKSDAMYLLSQARVAGMESGGRMPSPSQCMAPRVAATQLLSHRV